MTDLENLEVLLEEERSRFPDPEVVKLGPIYPSPEFFVDVYSILDRSSLKGGFRPPGSGTGGRRNSGELDVQTPQLKRGINSVERKTNLNVADAFDAAGSEPYLIESDVLGRMTPEDSVSGHRMDGYGLSFMGVDPRVKNISQADYEHTIIHETVHGLDFNDEFLTQYRDHGFSASEAVFLKDEMLAGRATDDTDRMEGATEFAARKLDSTYEKVVSDSYGEQVASQDRRMAEKDIYAGQVGPDRNVLDVEYSPESGELQEVGVFEYEGEAFRYVADVEGFDSGYGIGEVLDAGIDQVMEDPDSGYSWQGAESSVDIEVDQDEAYEVHLDDSDGYGPQRGSVESYSEARGSENGFDGPEPFLGVNGNAGPDPVVGADPSVNMEEPGVYDPASGPDDQSVV